MVDQGGWVLRLIWQAMELDVVAKVNVGEASERRSGILIELRRLSLNSGWRSAKDSGG